MNKPIYQRTLLYSLVWLSATYISISINSHVFAEETPTFTKDVPVNDSTTAIKTGSNSHLQSPIYNWQRENAYREVYKQIQKAPIKWRIDLNDAERVPGFTKWLNALSSVEIERFDNQLCRAFLWRFGQLDFVTKRYFSPNCEDEKLPTAMLACNLSCNINDISLETLGILPSLLAKCEGHGSILLDLMPPNTSNDIALFILLDAYYKIHNSLELFEEALGYDRPLLKKHVFSKLYYIFASENSFDKLVRYLPPLQLKDPALLEIESLLYMGTGAPPLGFCTADVVARVDRLIEAKTYVPASVAASCYTRSKAVQSFADEILAGHIEWLKDSVPKHMTVPICYNNSFCSPECWDPLGDYRQSLAYRLGKYHALEYGKNSIFHSLFGKVFVRQKDLGQVESLIPPSFIYSTWDTRIGIAEKFRNGHSSAFADKSLYKQTVTNLLESLTAEERLNADAMILAQLDEDESRITIDYHSDTLTVITNYIAATKVSEPQRLHASIKNNPVTFSHITAKSCMSNARNWLEMNDRYASSDNKFEIRPCHFEHNLCAKVILERHKVQDEAAFFKKACANYPTAPLPTKLILANKCITFVGENSHSSTENLLHLLREAQERNHQCQLNASNDICSDYQEWPLAEAVASNNLQDGAIQHVTLSTLELLKSLIHRALIFDPASAERLVTTQHPAVHDLAKRLGK